MRLEKLIKQIDTDKEDQADLNMAQLKMNILRNSYIDIDFELYQEMGHHWMRCVVYDTGEKLEVNDNGEFSIFASSSYTLVFKQETLIDEYPVLHLEITIDQILRQLIKKGLRWYLKYNSKK